MIGQRPVPPRTKSGSEVGGTLIICWGLYSGVYGLMASKSLLKIFGKFLSDAKFLA